MSTWVGALLAFVLVPIASHIFPQFDLGIINYYYSIINILFTVLLLGLDQAFLRFYSELETEDLRRRVFVVNIGITIAVIVGLVLLCAPASEWISNWIVGENNPLLLPVMIAHLIGLVVTRYYCVLFRLRLSFWKFTIFSICNTLLLKVAYIAGAFFGRTAHAGIYTTAVIALLLSAILLIVEKNSLRIHRNIHVQDILRQEFKYALPLIPAMLIATLNNNIPTLFLRQFSGFESIAEYSVGVLLASCITLLHNGLNTFLEPYIFKHFETRKENIATILEIFSKLAYFVCIGVILVQEVFFLFFKREYAAVTAYLPILLASSLWYTLGDFYNIGVKIQKRTSLNIPYYVVGVAVNVVLCLGLIPLLGNLGAAIAAATASFAVSSLKTAAGNRCYDLRAKSKIAITGPILLLLVICVNYFLAGSMLRHVLIAVLWIASSVIMGIHKLFLDFFRAVKK